MLRKSHETGEPVVLFSTDNRRSFAAHFHDSPNSTLSSGPAGCSGRSLRTERLTAACGSRRLPVVVPERSASDGHRRHRLCAERCGQGSSLRLLHPGRRVRVVRRRLVPGQPAGLRRMLLLSVPALLLPGRRGGQRRALLALRRVSVHRAAGGGDHPRGRGGRGRGGVQGVQRQARAAGLPRLQRRRPQGPRQVGQRVRVRVRV
ncbi:unnamed protein product [Tetraodon nigroviridis]|uniref:(spotted green pufferfish) hypothetical protein n=1 Tax=Tetraodon nigroviridis TaxID=99883 RepID=Q4SPH5_TETNG|nr:unnamed protein product [Tetraodon nigroviridis]